MTQKTNFLILGTMIFGMLSTVGAQELTITQDPRIDSLMALKKIMQTEMTLTDTYTIQLYYGTLEQAQVYLSNYSAQYDQWPAVIEYETPNYKVWAGNFYSRLEADRALMAIQKRFATAFILKPSKTRKDPK
ncbi:SPOR domain-containing protein [Flavobacteriaceae bacterium]|nr:SPOR domain-containing protein [Flavobacteriaceae bacterium]